VDLTREPEDPAIVPPVRAKTGQSPRTPSVVSRACKPRPAGRARGNFYVTLRTRTGSPSAHSRPASGGLRTSSWLASSCDRWPCDLPTKTTRDASNRLLPPNRTACTRTSCVPGSLSPLSRRGDTSRRIRLRAAFRGTGCFTTSENASAGRHSDARSSCPTASRPGVMSVGVLLPRR